MGIKLDIVKWGNSAALRLPATLLAQLGMQVGDAFEVDIAKGVLTLHPVKPKAERSNDAAIEAMKFALTADEGMAFLNCWLHGDFDSIRKEWPEAPEVVFKGAEVSRPGWHKNIRGPEYYKEVGLTKVIKD